MVVQKAQVEGRFPAWEEIAHARFLPVRTTPYPADKATSTLESADGYLDIKKHVVLVDSRELLPRLSGKDPSSYFWENMMVGTGHRYISDSSFPTFVETSLPSLKAKGREAISKVAPTTSEFDAATAVAEILSEGLPSMLGMNATAKGISAKTIGQEHLNYQFGVKPVIDDIATAYDVYTRSNEIWNKYVAEAGRLLTRRYNFPTVSSASSKTTTGLNQWGHYASQSNFGQERTPIYEDTKTTIKTWFVGKFTYYIPRDPFAGSASRFEKLYGVIPDIETVWNLTPWSWAADWVTDIGVCMANINAFQKDSLVMPEGFIMEHSVVDRTWTRKVKYANYNREHIMTLRSERKRRVPASPYGFDVTWDGFTPKQLSILAALGITRGRK